tara:strand:- start:223 stop:882 length:660 start_codon:yes stop_codon:yes gene_type:complete
MNILIKYFLTPISILLLLSCQRSEKKSVDIEDKSFITDFELIQRNTRNDSTIKINSPKAIIDQTTNEFEIFDSSIQLSNKTGKNLYINSGRSTLNSSQNVIRVFNNVNITLENNQNSFIKTDSFDWDLSRLIMTLNSPLEVNFNNTKIRSDTGKYNLNKNQLKLNTNIFKRNFFNINGVKQYRIEIISDVAIWSKENNLLTFKSNDSQVESTIEILSTK